MRPRLVTAALVGLAAALLATSCSEAGEAAPGASTPAPATEAADPPPRVVTLAFAGDTHFQLNLASLLQHPRGALGPIAGVLAGADLTMLNLESAVTDGGARDPKELEQPDRRFWYRTPARALDLLAGAGVDVVTVANNHGADYGPRGLADTLRAAAHGPLPLIGAGRDRAAAFAPYRVTVRRTRIAFLAADASTREGRSRVWEAGPRSPGIAAARGSRTRALLEAVRRADAHAEVVVVYLHWGVEGEACPSSSQRTLAHALSEAGADVVVGSHAHVQQGAGWLGDTYVADGLGNFLWYHNRVPDTGVLRVRIVDGHVVSDRWVPARIPEIGPPAPLYGPDAATAVTRWRSLRGCSGLAPRPSSSTDAGDDLPAYASSIRRIDRATQHRMRSTRRPGCPLPWSNLRALRVSYVGYDGRAHTGELVVAAAHARDVVGVFGRLYDARWPVRQLRPVSDFGGDDAASMAADNSSGFNCRRVAGTGRWSDHAYGAAIDLNPVENPDLHDGSVRPASGRRFAHRDRGRRAVTPPGVIGGDDVVVAAFAEIGWGWGGDWSRPDYQHFFAGGDR